MYGEYFLWIDVLSNDLVRIHSLVVLIKVAQSQCDDIPASFSW